MGAILQSLRREGRTTVTVAEIAQDGAGLPERFAVPVLQDRHGAVRIHRQEFRRVLTAVFVADVMANRSPSSPMHHISAWTLDEVLRPQTVSMAGVSWSTKPESLDRIGRREYLSPFRFR